MFYWLIKVLAYIPFWIFCPTILKGRKNLPKGKCILVVNHKSNFDPLVICNMIWREQHILAKKELFKHFGLRSFLKGMKSIPVDREKVEISTLKQCFSVLKNGKILTIFPEGTRNKTKEPLLGIKDGAGIIAIKTNTPIVPVWIKRKPRPFVLNKVYIGEPFYLTKDDENPNEIIKQKLLEVRDKNVKIKKTK